MVGCVVSEKMNNDGKDHLFLSTSLANIVAQHVNDDTNKIFPVIPVICSIQKSSLLATRSIRIPQTVINGIRLKSIQLKETVFDGYVANKMERFHGPHCTNPI